MYLLFIFNCIYFFVIILERFIFACAGSLMLHWDFLQLQQAGAAPLAVASLAAEPRPRHAASVAMAPRLQSTGAVLLSLGLSFSVECGVFLAPLYRQAAS